jgi:hypothetical protein
VLRRDALGGTGLDLPYPWTAGGHRQANQPDPFALDQSRLNQSEAMAHAAPNIGPIKKTVIKP